MFLNNRHYDPTTGVFISVDPLVTKTGEPYIYGAANPVTFSDPDGLCASTGSNCPDGIPVVQNGKSDHRAWRWTILNEKFSKPRARELFALDKPDGPLPAWGLPGNPEGSRHAHYALTFEVSDSASPEQMADLFVSNCSEIFPVNNCTSGFEEGDRLSLEAEFGPYTQGAPVEVTDVGPTGVRFEALYGHLEGEGRQISFRFVEFRGVTYLKVEARGPGSLVTKVPIIADFNNAAAANLWSQLADNLRAAAR